MLPPNADPFALLQRCRKLFLRRHEVQVRIGAHAFEQTAPQRLWIDVALYVPYAQSTPAHDRLDEVVDYDFVRAVVAERIAQGHIVLQETLCDDLARRLLAHPGVQAVHLSTSKPDVYPDCEAVGVEVFLSKPQTPSAAQP
jgi:dihydroneopterin aldolase